MASGALQAPLNAPAKRASVLPNEMPNSSRPEALTSWVVAGAACPSDRSSGGRERVLLSAKPSLLTRKRW
jgi:hypothetical protein